jgi:predicted HTH transcriptional regulator
VDHATHRMHPHSLDAYRAEESKLSKRAEAVLTWITEHGPHTDREVMQGMGFTEPNAVRPRITELIDAGKLMEVCSVRCPVTGKTVRRVDIRRARWHQQEIV